MQEGRTGESRIIKRYPNRKLYDTRDSRYVTLRQVAKLVQEGEDVRIIDNRTKEDLTSVTMAQILYEQERSADDERGGRGLPLHALKDLIGGGERLLATLRESSVAKFITRRSGTAAAEDEHSEEPAPEASVEPASAVAAPGAAQGSTPPSPSASPQAGRVKELVEQSREALDDIQRRIDERVRAVVGTFAPFLQMQAELRKIHQRLDEIERRQAASDAAAEAHDAPGPREEPPRVP